MAKISRTTRLLVASLCLLACAPFSAFAQEHYGNCNGGEINSGQARCCQHEGRYGVSNIFSLKGEKPNTGTVTFTPKTGGNICVRPSRDTRYNWTFRIDNKIPSGCTIKFAPGQSQTYEYEILKQGGPFEIDVYSTQTIGPFDYKISVNNPTASCTTPPMETNTVNVIVCVRDDEGHGLVRDVVFNEIPQTTNSDGAAAGCTVFEGVDDDVVKTFLIFPPEE